MKNLPITKTLEICSSHRGQTMVEAMMAMFVMGTAIWGSVSVYRSIGKVEKIAGEKTEIVLAAARIRGLAAHLVMGQWKMLTKSDCQGSPLGERFVASVVAAGDLQMVDKQRLDVLVTGPLRDQIIKVVTGNGAGAFKACGDAETLADPGLNLLAGSAYHQALCRCAAAATTYETFKAPLTDVSDYRNVYGCLQTSSVTPDSKMIYEVSAYLTDMVSGNRATCKEASTTDWALLLKRVDYTASSEGSGMSKLSGTYYLPLGDSQ